MNKVNKKQKKITLQLNILCHEKISIFKLLECEKIIFMSKKRKNLLKFFP